MSFVRTIEIEGFMPFRDRYALKFEEGQIVGILGQYGEDFSRSNRAGKSSFVDAMRWCLYGKSRAKKEVELVHHDCDFAEVSCEIYNPLDESSTWVTRRRTADNKGALELRGKEGERKAVGQEVIDRAVVGLNADEFEFTAFFKQNDIDQFMEADPQRKKEIMLRWMQTVDWGGPALAVNAFKLELKAEINKLDGQLLATTAATGVDEQALLAESAQLLKQQGTRREQLEALSASKLKIQVQLEKLKNVGEQREAAQKLEDRIQKLKARRPDSSQHKSALAKVEELLGKYEIVTKEKHDEFLDKRDRFSQGIGQLDVEIEELEDQVANFGKELTGICPILKQACSRIEADPDQLKAIRAALDGSKKKRARYEENREKINKFLTLYTKQGEWTRQKQQIEAAMTAVKQLESQIADLSNQRAEILRAIPANVEQQTMTLNGQLDEISAEQETLSAQVGDADRRIGEIREEVKTAREAADRKKALEHQIEGLNQQLGDAQYVEFMFGKNGIPSMELENSFSEIEEDANLILRKLRTPFHMEFEATRELGDWEPNCLVCGTVFAKGERTHKCVSCGADREKKRKDELSMRISENGTERPFYMDSGGGKILMSVAIRLALTMLARRRKGTNWGTIFLDEVFGQLDATNRRLMADLITGVLMKELGFEQVFIISHDQNIQSSLADQLIVRRHPEQGHSELLM